MGLGTGGCDAGDGVECLLREGLVESSTWGDERSEMAMARSYPVGFMPNGHENLNPASPMLLYFEYPAPRSATLCLHYGS